jgi:hypothetical protein
MSVSVGQTFASKDALQRAICAASPTHRIRVADSRPGRLVVVCASAEPRAKQRSAAKAVHAAVGGADSAAGAGVHAVRDEGGAVAAAASGGGVDDEYEALYRVGGGGEIAGYVHKTTRQFYAELPGVAAAPSCTFRVRGVMREGVTSCDGVPEPYWTVVKSHVEHRGGETCPLVASSARLPGVRRCNYQRHTWSLLRSVLSWKTRGVA